MSSERLNPIISLNNLNENEMVFLNPNKVKDSYFISIRRDFEGQYLPLISDGLENSFYDDKPKNWLYCPKINKFNTEDGRKTMVCDFFMTDPNKNLLPSAESWIALFKTKIVNKCLVHLLNVFENKFKNDKIYRRLLDSSEIRNDSWSRLLYFEGMPSLRLKINMTNEAVGQQQKILTTFYRYDQKNISSGIFERINPLLITNSFRAKILLRVSSIYFDKDTVNLQLKLERALISEFFPKIPEQIFMGSSMKETQKKQFEKAITPSQSFFSDNQFEKLNIEP